MRLVSIQTENDSRIFYARDRDGSASLTVDYEVPSVGADFSMKRGGWAETFRHCAKCELLRHCGIIEEAKERLTSVFGEAEAQPDLQVEGTIQQLRQRLCRFNGEQSVAISGGAYHDEWKIAALPKYTLNSTVVSTLCDYALAARLKLVEQIYYGFSHTLQTHKLRN